MPAATASLDLPRVTASELQELLTSGKIQSSQLIEAYLSHIGQHEDYLNALIARPTRESLLQQAKKLDDERSHGQVRSRLHGVPILIKDNMDIHPSFGMDTTAGSFALVGAKPRKNSAVVELLVNAGAIIIGKTNLSELSWFKMFGADCGWSPVGGQTQSAYVRGGFREDDTFAGHSNPAGSSTGSAVGVSAGYAPVALGTETEGSLIVPASRQALYTIKSTPGIISTAGIVPISGFADVAGPFSKSVLDLAILMDILVDPSKTGVPKGGYETAVTGSWDGLKIGSLDPDIWNFPAIARKPEPAGEAQMLKETLETYAKVKELAPSYFHFVDLISNSAFEINGSHVLPNILAASFKEDFEKYLGGVEDSKVKTVEDMIQFNKDHADLELPPRNPRQDFLEKAAAANLTANQFQDLVSHARTIGREKGIDAVFKKYDINIVIGPAESSLTVFAATAGYPIASLPVGYLDFNGRPHGLAAIASAHQEALLIQLQSAWEASFPARIPPALVSSKGKENL
jgi:amidase